MSKIDRHNKFNDIANLDKEIDYLLNKLEERDGKIVDVLPNINSVSELATVFIKQTNGTYKTYKKFGSDWMIEQTDSTTAFWTKAT